MAEYIEREALLNNRPEGRNPTQTGKEEYNKGWNDCRSAFYQCINDEPTADVAPVVRGRWIEVRVTRRTTEYKCSECGRWEKNRQPYCNCGARMDGD